MEKCIGCELCAGVCPADCIYVRGLDNPPDHPVSPGERYGYVYEINYLRCIHCDLCVEACPTEAITESKLFEFSFTNRSDAIYTKDELLVDDDGTPKQLPWEDWREGDDLHTSGWMRATSPSGNAAYEGEVQWSGELGYGVRAPEGGPGGPPRRRGHRHQAPARGAREPPATVRHAGQRRRSPGRHRTGTGEGRTVPARIREEAPRAGRRRLRRCQAGREHRAGPTARVPDEVGIDRVDGAVDEAVRGDASCARWSESWRRRRTRPFPTWPCSRWPPPSCWPVPSAWSWPATRSTRPSCWS